MKLEYLIEPRCAVALIHRDELLAEAARQRLVAEARAGAGHRPTRRRGRGYVVLALVVAVVLAGAALPYLAGATAGQKPAPLVVRYTPADAPMTSVDGGTDDGEGSISMPGSPVSVVWAMVVGLLVWFASTVARIVRRAGGQPSRL